MAAPGVHDEPPAGRQIAIVSPIDTERGSGADGNADLERRFGGLRRLHGDADYRALRAGRFAVVGLGGVGSWAAEALARSGVAGLTLIDLDHVSESNVNRQVQALGCTLGQSKGEALRARIADIHPGCAVTVIDDFVDAANWPALLREPVDVLIDACDQVAAKAVLAAWALAGAAAVVAVGAAGGKQRPQAVEVADLADVTHDPLLAALRQRLRQRYGAPRGAGGPPGGDVCDPLAEAGSVGRSARSNSTGKAAVARAPIGLRCVFSREAVVFPGAACAVDGTLNCHGFGSTVTVTATFGMVAAAQAIELLLQRRPPPRPNATTGLANGSTAANR